MKRAGRLMLDLFNFCSGEPLLGIDGNGGLVIFLRSILVAMQLFAIALLIKSGCEAPAGSGFSMDVAKSLVAEHFEWFGALFAGCYAAFYTRFSNQWSYLAEVYNQVMATKCQILEADQVTNQALTRWQVGLIADANTLHLDSKEIFASVIRSLLDQPHIYSEFRETLKVETCNVIEKRVGFVAASGAQAVSGRQNPPIN